LFIETYLGIKTKCKVELKLLIYIKSLKKIEVNSTYDSFSANDSRIGVVWKEKCLNDEMKIMRK
jgi:hypothetical protein